MNLIILIILSFKDDLNKIERGEQRIKKCHNNQRKLVDHTNNTLTTTTTSNLHLFNNNNENNKFLIDWTNKTSPITTITTNKCNQFIKEVGF